MKATVVMMLVVSLLGITGGGIASNFGEPKSIKQVMKEANGKDGLLKKVLDGKASDEEKKQLVELYVDLVDNKAPKGDETEWKLASGKAMFAATKVMLGREGAIDELKQATDCKACHDVFKGN